MTHPQCRIVLLQGHIALESHGLAASALSKACQHRKRLHRTINSVKKLQRVLSWRFLSGKTQTGVFIDNTHIHTYVRIWTQTHNHVEYCTQVLNSIQNRYKLVATSSPEVKLCQFAYHENSSAYTQLGH